jgi:hypothetical protein
MDLETLLSLIDGDDFENDKKVIKNRLKDQDLSVQQLKDLRKKCKNAKSTNVAERNFEKAAKLLTIEKVLDDRIENNHGRPHQKAKQKTIKRKEYLEEEVLPDYLRFQFRVNHESGMVSVGLVYDVDDEQLNNKNLGFTSPQPNYEKALKEIIKFILDKGINSLAVRPEKQKEKLNNED